MPHTPSCRNHLPSLLHPRSRDTDRHNISSTRDTHLPRHPLLCRSLRLSAIARHPRHIPTENHRNTLDIHLHRLAKPISTLEPRNHSRSFSHPPRHIARNHSRPILLLHMLLSQSLSQPPRHNLSSRNRSQQTRLHTLIPLKLPSALRTIAQQRRKLAVHLVGITVMHQHLRHHTSPHTAACHLIIDPTPCLTVNLTAHKIRKRHKRYFQYTLVKTMHRLPSHRTVTDNLRSTSQSTLKRRSARSHKSRTCTSHNLQSRCINDRKRRQTSI